MSRIIFLDFDGVVVPWSSPTKVRRPAKHSGEAISILNRVAENLNAGVVVTSSWRLRTSADDLEICLRGWGFKGKVLGKTLSYSATAPGSTALALTRGHEILEWLDSHTGVESFAVLDDDPSGLADVKPQLVLVAKETGIVEPNLPAIVKVLSTKYYRV